MTARALMVWGCTSNAGKSWITTALCRWFADRGYKVAPFKAQNMSNNARVADGGEMGCAQWFQALAARRIPEVRMNPVLLKPEHNTRSQVVVLGQVDRALTEMDWRSRSLLLWEQARPALDALLAENDIVIIEGAGSPAEINLSDVDYVNLLTARHAKATCLLVSDIDRGGSFAHLFGTWAVLAPEDQALLKGFVLNRFRGDASLLSPGPEILAERTGVPVVGVVPRIYHGLPDEDATSLEHLRSAKNLSEVRHRVVIVGWPCVSNFDEFRRLAQWPGVQVSVTESPVECLQADLVILPGSKHVPNDLAWLRSTGLAATIQERARRSLPILGICGGLQALGQSIRDTTGSEGDAEGLGVLPIVTEHAPHKRTVHTTATFPALAGFWQKLSGLSVSGYEIRTGLSALNGDAPETLVAYGDGMGFCCGQTMGWYLHGALENAEVLAALFGGDPKQTDPLEDTFALLAKTIDENMDMPAIEKMLLAPEPPKASPRLCVLTGGVRSGKSTEAERVGAQWGEDNVSFIATAQALDEEMAQRIAKHQSDRPTTWETIEAPLDVASAIRNAKHPVVLLDCLTLLVTNHLLGAGADSVRNCIEELLQAWRESGKDLVVVTNEVGLGIVPADAVSREFRDLLGWANQRLVKESTEAYFMVSGQKLSLSPVVSPSPKA